MDKKEYNDLIAKENASIQLIQKKIVDLQAEVTRLNTEGVEANGRLKWFQKQLEAFEKKE